ncbi:MAG: putative DNA-binding domain-containing protein [Zoogloeaceae bacterium]|nr:putative DNA-binding domain-containing protein [Zoogloeaceae bacterium]
MNSTTASTLTAQLHAFARAITADTAPPDTDELFRPTPQGGPPRIEIYRHAYRARLTDALRENYPVLHRVQGDEAFDELAEKFIAASPSQTPSIRWFGSALPAWLAANSAQLSHPALADLARMEWALCTAFDAADDSPLTVNDLLAHAPEAWPELRFTGHPSLRLIALDWAVEPLWHALSDNPEAETAAPEAQPHHLLVSRQNDQTQWRSVEAFEADLLQAALAGESFAELCERAAATQGEQAAAAVAGHLRVWVEAGLLTA